MDKIESLPNETYELALREVIETNLKRSISEFDVAYSAGSAKGDGFVGELYKIKVSDRQTKEAKLSLIVKIPPKSAARREMMTPEVFTREALFYSEVYPLYLKFQEEKGIDIEKDGFCQAPHCYKTKLEGLFLEDLTAKGFELFDRMKPVTADIVFPVMKSLGRMHALFYALKDQRPEVAAKFFDLPELFIKIIECSNNPMNSWFENVKEQSREVAVKSGNADLVRKVDEVLSKTFKSHLLDIFDRKKCEPYATLCHGDVSRHF